jgi:two-component system, OmpR family, phosphate regulon sensor histidine kinase PhoR
VTWIAFILGFFLGISLYLWKHWQSHHQLQRILNWLTKENEPITSLPLMSLVRREITHLDRQQQELEQELQSWQELLQKAPIGYLLVDEENQLLWCNQQARELLKIDRWQSGQVRLLLELVRSYELDRLIEQTRETQKSHVQKWVFHATNYIPKEKTTTKQSVSLKAYSCPLSQGRIGVFLENQQPLVELSRSRDRAFSDLTHELRTPLTAIGLVAEALQKRLHNPERRWVSQMLNEINRLINLVQDWLEISQLQENPVQLLRYESVELRELIFSVWQTLDPLAQQKEVTLAYEGPDLLYLEADKSRLTQVFLNLFDNGIKHSPPQKSIRVEVNTTKENLLPEESIKSPSWVKINIIDSGSGFIDPDLPYVFDRLYRGDTSRARNSSDIKDTHRGSGLGLALVREIIQAHGGSVCAQNHPQTGGAWLQLTLPINYPRDRISINN